MCELHREELGGGYMLYNWQLANSNCSFVSYTGGNQWKDVSYTTANQQRVIIDV